MVGGPESSERGPDGRRRGSASLLVVVTTLVAGLAALTLPTIVTATGASTATSTPTVLRVSAVGDESATPGTSPPPTRGQPQQVTPTFPPPPTTTTQPPIDVIPKKSGQGRRVVYSVSRQRVWAVDAEGRLVKTHAVSGRLGVPSPGSYSVFSRSLFTRSKVNWNIKWMYMVRFTTGPGGDNIGFHEIPTKCEGGRCWKLQTEAQLGQPLSSGCVRQAPADALWMWNWAQLGTKVVVIP